MTKETKNKVNGLKAEAYDLIAQADDAQAQHNQAQAARKSRLNEIAQQLNKLETKEK